MKSTISVEILGDIVEWKPLPNIHLQKVGGNEKNAIYLKRIHTLAIVVIGQHIRFRF